MERLGNRKRWGESLFGITAWNPQNIPSYQFKANRPDPVFKVRLSEKISNTAKLGFPKTHRVSSPETLR